MNTDYLNLPRQPNRHLSHIPGDNGALPVLGDTLAFLDDLHELVHRKYRQYGPIYRNNTLLQRNVILLGPEANEIVLKDSDRIFSNKKAWDLILDRLFPNGLMLKDFDEHRFHRKILQAAFKKASLEAYIDTMNPRLASGVAEFAAARNIGFKPSIKALLLDVAAQVFMGVKMGPEADRVNQAFVDTMMASMAVVKLPIPGTLFWRGVRGRRLLEEFIARHIDSKRQRETGDFFSQLCHATDEDGNVLSDEAVRDHLIFLLFAAHDTTTSTLCSVIYALAKNPEWQQRLSEEFRAVAKDQPDYDDLHNLESAALVMKEALRMHPPVPAIPRRCIADTEIFGYRIPKNTGIGLSPVFTHYMEEYWSEPYRFDPERFSRERAEDKKHFYQFIPFGGGAHKCLGLNFAEIQVKLFLFHLLKDYRVSIAPDYRLRYSQVPIQFPADDLPVRIDPL